MGVGAGLGKASPQMVEISLVEHAVFEEGQLLEENLRHTSHGCSALKLLRGRVFLQQRQGQATNGQPQKCVLLKLLSLCSVGATCKGENVELRSLSVKNRKTVPAISF